MVDLRTQVTVDLYIGWLICQIFGLFVDKTRLSYVFPADLVSSAGCVIKLMADLRKVVMAGLRIIICNELD